jgi:2-polyprenyl-3-methyl-5-hydroxy-6-metoxy-1,4-benzoquinol methylase
MTRSMTKIQADFDRLAQFSNEGWNHNNHYHDFLLKHIPSNCDEALEIGCGAGEFSRRLSQQSKHVLALDLSPEMIRIAKARSTAQRNIDYQIADVLQWDFPAAHFDCIASIATLHHLPLEDMLLKMKQALKPGGTLLVLDLYQDGLRLGNVIPNIAAMFVSAVYNQVKNGRVQASSEERAAWDEHGHDDVYSTLAEVRRCDSVLPRAQVKQHLLWRYSLVWKKP